MLSRRDFLKLIGSSALGLLLPEVTSSHALQILEPGLQGRVTDKSAWLRSEPSQQAGKVEMVWRDLVIPLTGAAISEDETAYNRLWYEVEGKGYIYSGGVQPVQTILNDPVSDLPVSGFLGEISVPFTDAQEEPDPHAEVSHRLYYHTVHWIMTVEPGVDGQVWYGLLDDKRELLYYIRASHIRIFSEFELAPLSPEVPDAEKLIEVRLTDQLVLAYEQSKLVYATRASTGGQFRDGRWTTPQGQFITSYKRPTRHMAAGDLASNGFDLPGVPWVLYNHWC